MAQLIITAVTLEGRTKSEVARDYGVSRFWVQQLIKRFDAEGVAALQPGPAVRIPARMRSTRTPRKMIIRLRKELSKQGLDAGAETIAADLARRAPDEGGRPAIPAVSTIWRILSRRGFVRPATPETAAILVGRRFAPISPTNAGRPTSLIGSWPTAPRSRILNIIDDHSRLPSWAARPAATPPAPRWSPASAKPLPSGESPPACSATMGRSSPPNNAATAGSPSRSNSASSG